MPLRDSRTALRIDWYLLIPTCIIAIFGLFTMASFEGAETVVVRQVIWLLLSVAVFLFLSERGYGFLKKTNIVVSLYVASLGLLALLFAVGHIAKGAQKWFSVGGFSFQPSDLAALALIILLAKYFSRRHVEIANVRHIIVSGVYALLMFVLIFFQPDFGSALIIFCIWLGMILVSGVSKRHLLFVGVLGLVAFGTLWIYGLKDYQKHRITNFLHPLSDVRGSGYNAYQAMIAVGSGQILGKGIGYGTQSRLNFLPEYKTDFIFAAFAEEWGLVGVALLFACFAALIGRIIVLAYHGATNFEILFGLGVAIFFMSHFLINVGMCLGLLPVTGITFPFMSYGGTNILVSYIGLGILAGMSRYGRDVHKEREQNEFLGL